VTGTNYENWEASVPHGVEARFYSQCSSTNTLAVEYARADGGNEPLWVVAGQQTDGRGRKGRTWVSEAGNLYTSLVFKPIISPRDLAALPFVIALAARDTVIELGVTAERVHCKWPNDILVDGHKICGILIESSARSSFTLEYVIVGIGLNLIHSPAEAAFKATSLKDSLGRAIDIKKALSVLSHAVKRRLDTWDQTNFEPIRQEWSDAAWGLGQTRRISTADDAFDALLVGIDGQGGLEVKLANGETRTITAADIFPVG